MSWRARLGRVATGGVLLGFLQGVSAISYNGILFEFLLRWLSVVAAVIFGGSAGDYLLNSAPEL